MSYSKTTYVNIGSPCVPRYHKTVATCSFGSSGLILQDNAALLPSNAQDCWTISDDTKKIKQTEWLFCILSYIYLYIHRKYIYMRVQSLLSINNCRPFLQRQTNWQAFKLPAISLKRWVFTIRVKRGKTFLCDFRYTLVKLFWTSFFLLF